MVYLLYLLRREVVACGVEVVVLVSVTEEEEV